MIRFDLPGLVIGEDKVIRHRVTTGALIRVTSYAGVAATALSVRGPRGQEGIQEPLDIGTRLRFGNLIVVLSAAAAIGARSLAVNALAGALDTDANGRKIPDVTGWTFEWVLRRSNESTAAILTKASGSGIAIAVALDGEVEVSIASTNLLSEAPGPAVYTFRRKDAGFETPLTYGNCPIIQLSTRD